MHATRLSAKKPAYALLVVSLVLVSGLVFGESASALAGARSEGPPLRGDLAETTELKNPAEVTARRMAEFLNVSFDEALSYLSDGSDVQRLYSSLNAKGPAAFDDLYIEYQPRYAIVVLVRKGGMAEVSAFITEGDFAAIEPDIVIREVTYGHGDLEEAAQWLERASGLDFQSWVEIQDETIFVNADSASEAEQLQALIDSGAAGVPASAFKVNRTDRPFQFDANTFGGLDLNLQSNHAAECNSGFSVEQTDSGTANGLATAAHCANALELNSGDDIDFQAESFGGSQDTQWHKTPGYTDQPWVRDGGTSHRTVTDRTPRADQIVGQYVCLSKRNDTVACGNIQSKSFDLGAGFNNTFIRVNGPSSGLSVGGDSGGPWWAQLIGTPGCTCAYGTDEGHPADDPNDAVYMAVNYMGAINIRVLVG